MPCRGRKYIGYLLQSLWLKPWDACSDNQVTETTKCP